VNNLAISLNAGEQTDFILLDFAQAFDRYLMPVFYTNYIFTELMGIFLTG